MAAVGRKAHELSRTVNRDTAFNTDRFAKFTANAFFLIYYSDFEELRRIGAGLHGNTVKGTDINAEFAGGAGFGIDFGFRNGQGFNLLNSFAFRINNGFDRAMNAADTAIDTKSWINVEHRLFFARDRFRGAFNFAKCAADASAENGVWQRRSFE
jgi:hypothetical protein